MGLAKALQAQNEFCLCGCGQRITKHSRRGFAQGHFGRTDEGRAVLSTIHKGKTISPTQRQQLSSHFKGRTFTPSALEKLSATKRGPLNPNWRGGVSLDPYPKNWWAVRIRIRKRDGGQCLLDPAHSIKPWRHADIHHIDSNQANCDDRNLISLCRSCHSKVERDWENYMTILHSILAQRYGYQYP